MPELFDLRKDFNRGKLEERGLVSDPFLLFDKWIGIAIKNKIPEPNSMVLSTCGKNLKSTSRVVLLKYYDNNGFMFFSNYKSRKGVDISENPNASLLFFWPELEQQIRIEGVVKKTSTEVSDQYFEKRSYESRISAIISPQSYRIKNRYELESKINKLKKNKDDLKRPEYWGGYALLPELFEFWQGRPGRVHDRIIYKQVNHNWEHYRLAP